MSKLKFLKLVKKRKGILSKLGLKKRKIKQTEFMNIKRRRIELRKDKSLVGVIKGFKQRGSPFESISVSGVEPPFRGKGLGTKLFESFIKSSKKLLIRGNVIGSQQLIIRKKFEPSSFVKLSPKVTQVVTVKPNKKIFNRTTGKVRFIRVRGRIIPIRGKKK